MMAGRGRIPDIAGMTKLSDFLRCGRKIELFFTLTIEDPAPCLCYGLLST